MTRLPPPAAQSRHDVVVMLSGGIDSTVLLHDLVTSDGARPLALHFAGLTSPHEREIVEALTTRLGVELVVVDMSSFLQAVATGNEASRDDGRLVFGTAAVLSMALAFALARGIPSVAVGLNCGDASAYIENHPNFLDHLRQGLRLVGADCTLLVPYLAWTKAEVLRRGIALGIDLGATLSCMMPIAGMHDGMCESCRDRQAAFLAIGQPDPAPRADRRRVFAGGDDGPSP